MPAPALLLSLLLAASGARAEGWVGPLTRLSTAPVDLADNDAPLAERVALARRLGRYGPAEGAVDGLLAGLADKPPAVLREVIFQSLARRASPRALDALATLLEGKGQVPIHAWSVLSAVGDGRALDLLAHALERPEQRAAAARALRRAGPKAAPVLGRALGGVAGPLAARSLMRMGPAALAALPALIAALDSEDLQLRRAAAQALEAIGDTRAAPALLARIDDPAPVAEAALRALGKLATVAEARALEAALERAAGASHARAGLLLEAPARADATRAGLLLQALSRADAARALPWLQRALQSDGELADAAQQVLERAQPSAVHQGLLVAQLAGPHADGAASALVRLGLPGVRALVDGCEAAKPAPIAMQQACARALALGLRAFGEELDAGPHARALERLRALPASAERMVLRGLARDPLLSAELPAAWRAAEADMRAAAGWAALWLGPRTRTPELARALASALSAEREPEAFRRLASAARAWALRVPIAQLEPHFGRAATGPEALLLAASQGASAASAQARAALAVRVRRQLSTRGQERLRVAAAQALVLLGDRRAAAPLVAVLSDPSPALRLAAAHALMALDPVRAREALAGHVRVEADPRVYAGAVALLRRQDLPGSGPASRSAAAQVADGHTGASVLEVRLRGPAVPAGPGPEVDVLLFDGRWLRLRPLWRGQLLLADLPPGRAQLRVLP